MVPVLSFTSQIRLLISTWIFFETYNHLKGRVIHLHIYRVRGEIIYPLVHFPNTLSFWAKQSREPGPQSWVSHVSSRKPSAWATTCLVLGHTLARGWHWCPDWSPASHVECGILHSVLPLCHVIIPSKFSFLVRRDLGTLPAAFSASIAVWYV